MSTKNKMYNRGIMFSCVPVIYGNRFVRLDGSERFGR